MMKYILILSFVLTITSCNDWLDVKPSSQIKSDELLVSEEGYMTAITGAYSLMMQDEVYGAELTMATLEILTQPYDNVLTNSRHSYNKLAKYEYENESYSRTKIDPIWSNLYNVIVNLNNILENIDENKSVLSDKSYSLIKGETLALRAYIHLDLLRLYAPSSFNGIDHITIPYYDRIMHAPNAPIKFNDLISNLVKDLNTAKELMADHDPILDEGYDEDVFNKYFNQDVLYSTGNFYLKRAQHLNYYAVNALLARALMYRGLPEDKIEAAKCAQEVIDSEKFPLCTNNDFGWWLTIEEKIRTLNKEFIFCLYKRDLAQVWETYFKEGGKDKQGNSNANKIFHISDYKRGQIFQYDLHGSGTDWRNREFFENEIGYSKEYLAKYKEGELIPLIKISEMYLIVAEANQSKEVLDEYRQTRGLTKWFDDRTLDDEIKAEYGREYLGEGQYFYYCKRTNTWPDESTSMIKYTLPLPKAEQEFGNIK